MLKIEQRESWGAVGQTGAPLRLEVDYVVIHHGANAKVENTVEAERALLRQWEGEHMKRSPPFVGLGYNFVVFPSGRVYMGRGWGRVGAHAGRKDVNMRSLGICYAVHGDTVGLTPEARDSIRALIEVGLEEGYVSPRFKLTGHLDHKATRCPGKKVYAQLGELDPRVSLPGTREYPKLDELEKRVEMVGVQSNVLAQLWRKLFGKNRG